MLLRSCCPNQCSVHESLSLSTLSRHPQRKAVLSKPTIHQRLCCLRIFIHSTALSALCADVVFSLRKQPGGHRPPLGSPFGRAGERSASLRGCAQLQIWEKCGDCCLCTLSVMTITRYRPAVWAYCQGHSLELPAGAYPPSQSRLSAMPALPKGEPRAAAPPNLHRLTLCAARTAATR